jgi:hypothetical protein
MLREDFETNRRAAEEIRQLLNILEQHSHLLELLLEEREAGLRAVGQLSALGSRLGTGPPVTR